MDEYATRIQDLIVDTCVVTQSLGVLLHIRAELLMLAEDTSDADAADAACGAAAEIDAAVQALLAPFAQRRAS